MRRADRARAREAYRGFVRRLADDLGLAPPAELRALHDSLGAIPASAALAGPAPTADEGFVGRSTELRRIAELLGQGDCRLVSIIGPGGVGKTRLARRALQELSPRHADGATFVPLEDVADAGELGARLARELRMDPARRTEPIAQVIEALRGKQLLLVLDNFEHLAGDCAIVGELLDACPGVKILVTSRVRLGLAGEWSLPLEGLPCPEAEDADRIEAFDAARLFLHAARRVEPALVPATEAAAIVEICRQLEGLPLALELAAAWTRVLSCHAIAKQLRQGTDLLSSAESARSARHASIEVVFDQSWQLLTPVERDALSRLSVFRGGFSAEAARSVAGASLPVLGALTDKSLLRRDGARNFMHALVQQLAAARLGDGEARAATESAHARHFHRLMAQLRHAVESSEREALGQMDAEFENCRTAWRWSIAHGHADTLERSTFTLLHFCDHRGRFHEALGLLREALESPAARTAPGLVPMLSSAIAHFEYRQDRYADALARAEGALAASRANGDHDTRLQCFKVLGACCLRLGRYVEARRHFRQALRQSPASTDPRNAAAMLDNLALVEKAMGHYAEALRMSMESLVQHRRLADVAGEALCLNNLGSLLLDQGDHDSSLVHLKAGLALCERHELVGTRGFILANLTEIALKAGDLEATQAHARRAMEVARQTGNRALHSWLELQLAGVALRRGDLAGARRELRAALEMAIDIGAPSLQLAGVACFGDILEAQGELDCARHLLAFASGHPSISAPAREEIRGRLARWGVGTSRGRKRPTPDLDELVHRIVVETDVAHSPLIATLRG